MIYLLYGSDTARSRAKLKEIVEEYREKAGGHLNLHRFDAEENDPTAVKEVLEASSLFGAKKLVIVEHALRAGKFQNLNVEKFKHLDNAAVVFWERELDAAAKKHLGELGQLGAKIQEFRASAPVGDDKAIFKLGDVFFTSPKEARRHLLALLASGHDERRIFFYLANQARTLLLVRSYLEAREPVSAEHGIHPYVLKKASAIARGRRSGELEAVLRNFFEEDVRIKTGVTTPRESLLRILSS